LHAKLKRNYNDKNKVMGARYENWKRERPPADQRRRNEDTEKKNKQMERM
jgi:hypothetical protein